MYVRIDQSLRCQPDVVKAYKIHGTMKTARRSFRQSLPSLHGLMLFEASARHLNFSAAAKELAITQSAVSHGVKQLEEALGHPLFLRENRALTLTSQGMRLFTCVSRGFSAIAETVDDIRATNPRDSLVVSCSTVLAQEWLLPRLPQFRQTHPDLRIEIRCHDRDPDLMANGIDVQLRLGDGNWPGLSATPFWAERIVAVASPAYLRDRGPITLASLPDHRLVGVAARPWGIARAAGVVMEVNDAIVAMTAAQSGEGIALGWRPLIDRALREGRLVQVLPEVLRTGRHHYVLTVKTATRRITRQFCDWLLAQEDPVP